MGTAALILATTSRESEAVDTIGLADILGGNGRYRDWPKADRERLVSRCANLIQKHASAVVGTILSFKDLQAALAEAWSKLKEGERTQAAYSLCGAVCATAAADLVKDRPTRIAVTFESGMKGIGTIQSLASRIADDSVIVREPGRKRDDCAFQAADLIASGLRRIARPVAGALLPVWQPQHGPRRLLPRLHLHSAWLRVEQIRRVMGLLQQDPSNPVLRGAFSFASADLGPLDGGSSVDPAEPSP